jgi:hypothetical protein
MQTCKKFEVNAGVPLVMGRYDVYSIDAVFLIVLFFGPENGGDAFL